MGNHPNASWKRPFPEALRDNLTPLQRTADELHQACADFAAASGSSKPSNALPALLRAQTAASSLASGLSVLTNFLLGAMKPAGLQVVVPAAAVAQAGEKTLAGAQASTSHFASAGQESEWAEETPQAPVEPEELRAESRGVSSYTEELPLEPEAEGHQGEAESIEPPVMHETLAEGAFEAAGPESAATSEPAFDLT